ncbi:MAG: MBL fold metallo-hydrolase [Candidatus Polarisedimenticolia bacterium]
MRVTYYGQACTLIEAAGRRILTDPWLTEGAYFGSWFHTHLLEDAGITPGTFPKDGLDYLFLSHEHQDHLDPATLRHLRKDLPVLICRFPSPRFRRHVESLGFTDIRELESGRPLDLGDSLSVTLYGSAEYTNDSAILVEGEGVRVFNETDCKLGFEDLRRVGERGIDLGFFMFSGANWFPIMYDYPQDTKAGLVQRRRQMLLKSFVQRVKLTRPRVAVPSSGPCMVLEPGMLWLNSTEMGIFIDPKEAIAALQGGVSSEPLFMAATDVWDSTRGFIRQAPDSFHGDRGRYMADAAARMAPRLAALSNLPAAGTDLGACVMSYFQDRVGALSPDMRRRVGARLLVEATGPQAGAWTVDFNAAGSTFVREGRADDWTYRMKVEDRLLYPFMTGRETWLEDLFLSLRVELSRRPDVYNEPLYHFLYDPDPGRLSRWYATH